MMFSKPERLLQQNDKGRPADVTYLSFRKAFDSIPHSIFIWQLRNCGLEETMVRWTENCLYLWAQRVAMNGSASAWWPTMSRVPQGLILFDVLINDLGDDLGCTTCKFINDVKLEGETCIMNGRT